MPCMGTPDGCHPGVRLIGYGEGGVMGGGGVAVLWWLCMWSCAVRPLHQAIMNLISHTSSWIVVLHCLTSAIQP